MKIIQVQLRLLVSHLLNPLKGMSLRLTRCRVDALGRATSGSYPYDVRSLAAHVSRAFKLYERRPLPVSLPRYACGLVRNVSSRQEKRRPEASLSMRAPLQPVQDTTYETILAQVSKSGKGVRLRKPFLQKLHLGLMTLARSGFSARTVG
jgi:hypothetical protein